MGLACARHDSTGQGRYMPIALMHQRDSGGDGKITEAAAFHSRSFAASASSMLGVGVGGIFREAGS